MITYQKIDPCDYLRLTRIMTVAFDEDTRMHTHELEGGPKGYHDGTLVKWLNEQEHMESFKVIYDGNIIGAYTVEKRKNQEYCLEMLYLDPRYREYHFGTTVWYSIEQKYSEAKLWIVETPDYSTRNHHFYTKKCGFTYLRENTYESSKSYVFQKKN